MRWPWRRRREAPANGDAARVEAEATLAAERQATKRIARQVRTVADLPPEEFTRRVVRTFGGGWA